MKNYKHYLTNIAILIAVILVNHACVDPLYDMAEGINTEIQIGGEYLSLPIGSTDTIYLKDFLSAEEMEFLKTLEDGGYGITITDSMTIEDLLKELETENLKFPVREFSNTTLVNFGEMNLGDFIIDGFSITDSSSLNAPSLDVEDLSATINLDTIIGFQLTEYQLEEAQLKLDDIKDSTSNNSFLNDISAFGIYLAGLNPEFPFDETTNLTPLTVQIEFDIDVPEGITKVHEIDLEAGAKLEIEIALKGVEEAMGEAVFTPDIEINPSDLFEFNEALENGKIKFGNAQKLGEDNSYHSSRVYTINKLLNLPEAEADDDIIKISKDIITTGSMHLAGKVLENKINQAKEIELLVRVKLTDLKIKTIDFDMPTFHREEDGKETLEMELTDLPPEVEKIDTVYFKTSQKGLAHKNLIINFNIDNTPALNNPQYLNYKIDSIEIIFPENFHFDDLVGNIYSKQNQSFDPETGFTVSLDLAAMSLDDVPIENQSLNWEDELAYNIKISIDGRVTDDINISDDIHIVVQSDSEIKLESVTMTTQKIEKSIDDADISLAYEIDISNQVKRLDEVNVSDNPPCYLNIDIVKPNLPLDLKAELILLQFSDLYEFYPNPNLNSNNEYEIRGDIPENIQLQLKRLHINRDLVDGKLSIDDTFKIVGDIFLQPGTINTKSLEGLDEEQIKFIATVDDMYVESSDIQLNTLSDHFSDSTNIDLDIDEIPTEILALDSIIFHENAVIALELNIENMPDLGNNVVDTELTIQFPKMLIFKPGMVNDENQLILKDNFEDCRLQRTLNLQGLRINQTDLNGSLAISEKIHYNMDLMIENPTINSDDLSGDSIKLHVSANLIDWNFKSIYGKFNVEIDTGDEMPEITLDDLPEFMRNDDVVLDVLNPILALSVESNLGIPIDNELTLTKHKDGTALTDQILALPFSIPKSESPEEVAAALYWFAPGESGKPEAYNYVPANIQTLLNPIPDAIALGFDSHINQEQQHFIDLTADYNLKLKYDITIPFTFGEDLKITIRNTIDSIDLDLEEMNVKTGALELLATISNSIPLDLKLELLMLDANDNILATSPEQLVHAGAPNGKAIDSDITIRITENLEDLQRLDKIELVFRASSNHTVAGTPIKPENFIKANLKARILGGINITL